MIAENAKIYFRNALIVVRCPASFSSGFSCCPSGPSRRAAEVEGPSRLVRGPHDTIYVQIDRSIAKVSSEGELLSVLDLDTDASVPDVADFFVEEDGRLLFARRNSPLLQYYSPEGEAAYHAFATCLCPPTRGRIVPAA